MNKERLQEIKDSIDLQLAVAKSIGIRNELAEEEKELYDEVIRLGNVINGLEKVFIDCDYQYLQRKLKKLKGEKNEKD